MTSPESQPPEELKVLPRAMLRMLISQYEFMIAWMEEHDVPEEYVEAVRAQLLLAGQALAEFKYTAT